MRVLGERWENGKVLSSLDFCAGKFCSAIAFYGSGSYNYCTAVEIRYITQISNRSLNYKGC